MNSDLLRMAGEAIYGPQWQAPLARALRMSPRHMSLMMNPNTPNQPTERLRPLLIGLLRAKSVEVATALQILSQ